MYQQLPTLLLRELIVGWWGLCWVGISVILEVFFYGSLMAKFGSRYCGGMVIHMSYGDLYFAPPNGKNVVGTK